MTCTICEGYGYIRGRMEYEVDVLCPTCKGVADFRTLIEKRIYDQLVDVCKKHSPEVEQWVYQNLKPRPS